MSWYDLRGYEIIMLILTRKIGETITIGDDIHIHVLSMKGGQVRIGVEAPKDVQVNREEVFERLAAKKEGEGS